MWNVREEVFLLYFSPSFYFTFRRCLDKLFATPVPSPIPTSRGSLLERDEADAEVPELASVEFDIDFVSV